MEWLQGLFSGPVSVKVFSIFSTFGEEMVCIALLGLFYWGLNKEIGKFMGLNLAVSVVLNPMIKNVVLRLRPYFTHPTIKALKPVEPSKDLYDVAAQGYSFPSGHSENSVVAFGSAALKTEKKWLRIILFIVPVLVGISRFVLGVHYPTDVLCGWAVGIVILAVVPFLHRKIKNKYVFLGILLASGIPGFFYCTSDDFYTGYGILLGACVSIIFEEKFVKFENTPNVFMAILRTAVGGGIFMLLNIVFKLPFSKEFLSSGTTAAYLVRTFRYAINLFIICGLYPMVFKPMDRLWRKK